MKPPGVSEVAENHFLARTALLYPLFPPENSINLSNFPQDSHTRPTEAFYNGLQDHIFNKLVGQAAAI